MNVGRVIENLSMMNKDHNEGSISTSFMLSPCDVVKKKGTSVLQM